MGCEFDVLDLLVEHAGFPAVWEEGFLPHSTPSLHLIQKPL